MISGFLYKLSSNPPERFLYLNEWSDRSSDGSDLEDLDDGSSDGPEDLHDYSKCGVDWKKCNLRSPSLFPFAPTSVCSLWHRQVHGYG